jgi:hypothetical protein
MVNLGVLEHDHGRFEEARRWYREAIDTGYTDHAGIQRKLRDLDRHEEQRSRAAHFGQYGWQAWANPELMGRSGADTGSADDTPEKTKVDETGDVEDPPPQ